MNDTNKNQDELGALWIRKGAKGEYMSGTITIAGTAYPIVCFTNQNKKNEKHPDWRILKSKPRDDAQQNNPLPTKVADTDQDFPDVSDVDF